MTTFQFRFDDLHLLWPRADAAIRCLAYLIPITLKGIVPSFTDQFLAKKFHRHPETIARWRARWEAMGILKTFKRGRKTHYSLSLEALEAKIREAQAAQEQLETEAHNRELARRVQEADEIAANLRQQWEAAGFVTQHDLGSELDIVPDQQKTNSKGSFVFTEPEKVDFRDPWLPTLEQAESSEPAHSQDQQWFLQAARRLVLACGEQWNPTLQKALETLAPNTLINLVSALWDQTLRGNVRSAARWLNTATQKALQGAIYRPSKTFRLPAQLPPLPVTPPPPSPIAALPSWLPPWATQPLTVLLQAVGKFDWVGEVDGGIEVWYERDRRFIPDPQGPYASY